MSRILGHGKAKYTTGTCLDSSRERSWRGLLRSEDHPRGECASSCLEASAMSRILGHGKAKYTTGTCLDSSRERGWRGLLAERWHHSEGDLGEVLPRDTEVIVMLSGQLRVRRRGEGQLQQHEAVPGTVWLCPAGVREDMIHLYGEIQDSIHLYLPALAKTALQDLDVDPKHLQLRYAGGFRDPLIEAIGRTVSAELSDPSPVATLLVDTLSAALGVYVMRNYSNLLPGSHAPPPARGPLEGRRPP